ncbi:MAG: hypothetical protein IJ268_02030, partial [Proteobacteria bacterium]|nr:hypothetical protein [Pseudomonadota bacterium]
MKSKLILCIQCCLFAAFTASCGGDDSKPSEPAQSCTNENEMMCGDECIDITSNDKYCGNCDTSCKENEH